MALTTGDRIAFAAKFLKNTCQFTGEAPTRRGTFLKQESWGPFARVRWDNEADVIASSSQAGDEEWEAEVRTNGSLVNINNIAKVGSPRFCLNCI